MIILLYGPLGFESAKRLYDENTEKVQNRFPGFFLEQFEEAGKCEVSIPSDAVYVKEITDGGLFGALWQMGEELAIGMEIYLNSVPTCQEAVEILELFDESPYECSSKGAYVAAFEAGSVPLEDERYIIGLTKDGKKRVVIAPEGERFLTPPARQQKDLKDRDSDRANAQK